MKAVEWMAADYLIIGGGSAGACLAARLSENPKVTVALFEAGPEQRDIRLAVPGLLGEVLGSKVADWDFATLPQEELGGRRLRWPRGKVMGGSSAINGMCYERGDLRDYDRWADLGAEGWSGGEALHFFKASECHSEGVSQWHGDDGPLHVTRPGPDGIMPATRLYLKAAQEAGHRMVEEFASPAREGAGVFDRTTKNGERCSVAKAYLTPAVRARANLTIVPGALARRVRFDGRRAAGLSYEVEGVRREAVAKREVILCAGAIGTPQLLMLSGVGPAAHLKEHGIGVVADRPGVGGNLKDHLDIGVLMLTEPEGVLSFTARGLVDQLRGAAAYLTSRSGYLASNIAEGNGFVRSSPDKPRPDIQIHFVPALAPDHGASKNWGRAGVTIHACNLYPTSTGRISLASADPRDPPAIDPRYLTGDGDLEVMIAAAKAAHDILSQPVFDGVRKGFLRPAERPDDDAGWERLIRDYAETIYHPVGTARMGREEDEGAVCDAMGRVYGTTGLRVVDASLFPDIPGGNTNAPTVMTAERIARRGMMAEAVPEPA